MEFLGTINTIWAFAAFVIYFLIKEIVGYQKNKKTKESRFATTSALAELSGKFIELSKKLSAHIESNNVKSSEIQNVQRIMSDSISEYAGTARELSNKIDNHINLDKEVKNNILLKLQGFELLELMHKFPYNCSNARAEIVRSAAKKFFAVGGNGEIKDSYAIWVEKREEMLKNLKKK